MLDVTERADEVQGSEMSARRYCGDVEIRIGLGQDRDGRRIYVGSVSDHFLVFRGWVPIPPGRLDPASSEAYLTDAAATRLLATLRGVGGRTRPERR